MALKIEKLNISFEEKTVFKDFSIYFEENRINCILAKSGFGKTTLLNYIAKNFDEVSYAFQDFRLLENESVFNNIFIPLKNKIEKIEAEKQISAILKTFDLENLKNEKCRFLSGGEKSRVNLARALLFPAKILLLDEPFQNIDEKLKNKIMAFIKNEQEIKGQTVIFVTHNKNEALFLSDKIFEF